MRREHAKVETPTVRRALKELLVPSIPLKLIRGSNTGRNDHIFLIPGGRPLFIEFKDPEGSLSAKQEYWITLFKDLGYDVEVHDNVEAALKAIASKVVAAALHEKSRQVPSGTWSRRTAFRPRIEKNEHYARSVQFLEEARRREQDAGDSPA